MMVEGRKNVQPVLSTCPGSMLKTFASLGSIQRVEPVYAYHATNANDRLSNVRIHVAILSLHIVLLNQPINILLNICHA